MQNENETMGDAEALNAIAEGLDQAEASRAQMIEGEPAPTRKRDRLDLLKDMSAAELTELAQRAARLAEQRSESREGDVRRRLVEIAKSEGFDAYALFGAGRKRASMAGRLPPKYRELGGGTRTWVGRGQPPRWYREAIRAGVTPAEMLIPVTP